MGNQCSLGGCQQDQSVHIHVRITNNSSITFTSPRIYLNSGRINKGNTLQFIPNNTLSFTCTKKFGSLYGVEAVLVYRINSSETNKLGIMFSTPYISAYHNRFGFSITDKNADQKLFNTMYADRNIANEVTELNREKFYINIFSTGQQKNKKYFRVRADMNYTYKAILTITIENVV